MIKKRVYAKLGRAGLGNELFPYMRAVDVSADEQIPLLPPRWIQPRLGPWLRKERDQRNYWTLFRPPSFAEVLQQLRLDLVEIICRRLPKLSNIGSSTIFVSGMDRHFESLKRDGPWYRDYLTNHVRKGQLSSDVQSEYLSVHVRLGDFARPVSDTTTLRQNNMGTPLEWYADVIRFVKEGFEDLEVLVSSDGSDEELAPLLCIPGVARTSAKNALDELFIMSKSCGIVGSRSTFSSWGAFFGDVPMLLIEGGNAYPPHDDVWEDTCTSARISWLAAVAAQSESK